MDDLMQYIKFVPGEPEPLSGGPTPDMWFVELDDGHFFSDLKLAKQFVQKWLKSLEE